MDTFEAQNYYLSLVAHVDLQIEITATNNKN